MLIKEAVVLRVKILCEERHIALNQLATRSGMTPSTIYSMMDRQRQDVSIRTLKKLCDGLDISITEFFNHPIFEKTEQEIQ